MFLIRLLKGVDHFLVGHSVLPDVPVNYSDNTGVVAIAFASSFNC